MTYPPFIDEPSQLALAFGHCPVQFFTSPPAGSSTSRDQESMCASAEFALIVRVMGPWTPLSVGVNCGGSSVMVPVGGVMSRTKLLLSADTGLYFDA